MAKIFFFIGLFFLTSNCSNPENKNLSEIEAKYIENYENWNLDTDSQNKQDSVLYYIDELINISEDDFYKVEKIKFLYRIEKNKDALSVFKTLNEQNSFMIELLRTLIEIKDNSNNTDSVLQSICHKYEDKKLTIEENLYKIALDYYFKGGNYAIDEINDLMTKEELSESNKQLYEILQEKIQNEEDSLEVLFYLYNL